MPIDLALEADYSSTVAVLQSCRADLVRISDSLQLPIPAESVRASLSELSALSHNCLMWPSFGHILARVWQNVHDLLKRLSTSPSC